MLGALINSKGPNLEGQLNEQLRQGTPQVVGAVAIGERHPGARLAPYWRQCRVASDLDANTDLCQLSDGELSVEHLHLALQQPVGSEKAVEST